MLVPTVEMSRWLSRRHIPTYLYTFNHHSPTLHAHHVQPALANEGYRETWKETRGEQNYMQVLALISEKEEELGGGVVLHVQYVW